MNQLLDQLNSAQREAVQNYSGPSMVLAGAGSGKTRVLTYRIAHLIQNGVDPFNVLALTFTNKAAKEMQERIGSLLHNTESFNLWIGTFHSVFSKILRREAEKIGYPSNFTIYDTMDSKSLIKTIVKEKGLDDKIYKPNLIYNRISAAKNNLISVTAYLNNEQIRNEDKMNAKPKMGEIYQTYAKRCFQSGAMDFDDLLFKTYYLLEKHPDVLYKYQHQFKYILVDEYQDTNYAQYLIIKKLAALNENICVVGDDAQSIYSFRGADIQNILNFKKDYPDTKTYKLEQNYRSSQNIVGAANSIIKKNEHQLQKDVWTANDEGDKITVVKTPTDNEEGNFVAHKIFELKNNLHLNNDQFAILYRTNAQSRSMEEALRKQGIPYKIYGGLSFYQRKEIKDLIAYFRLTINHRDEEALRRVINYPARGIGKTTMDKIILAANDSDQPMWDVISDSNLLRSIVNSGAANKIENFVTSIQSFASELPKKNAFDVASHIAQSSGLLKELYADKTPEGISRYENIQELLNGIKEFVVSSEIFRPLEEFMSEIALVTDQDQEKEEDSDKVVLMTIHASKGLEFPYVFIVGLEEDLFPSQMSGQSRTDLEEERRLFYVALTRAEKQVFLSYASTRFKWGNLIYCEPSRFLDEIDDKYKAESVSAKKRPAPRVIPPPARKLTRITPSDSSSTPKPNVVSSSRIAQASSSSDFKAGDTVEHQKFGRGKVKAIDGNGASAKALIDFEKIGEKQLLLKFARLKVIK